MLCFVSKQNTSLTLRHSMMGGECIRAKSVCEFFLRSMLVHFGLQITGISGGMPCLVLWLG